jgi:hypothetical protein
VQKFPCTYRSTGGVGSSSKYSPAVHKHLAQRRCHLDNIYATPRMKQPSPPHLLKVCDVLKFSSIRGGLLILARARNDWSQTS